MERVCSFFGHRNVERTDKLLGRVCDELVNLIENHNVKRFLFGSRSAFDALCHQAVTKLQKNYPDIRRVMYACKSEYVCKKAEKEEMKKLVQRLTGQEIEIQDYDEAVVPECLYKAGKASYIERNKAMINASDFCLFYYNPDYLPPKRKRYRGDINGYQPKSGTFLAFEYAYQQIRAEKKLTIINLFEK